MKAIYPMARGSAGLFLLALVAAAGCGDSTPKATAVREVDTEAVRKDQSQMENFMKTQGKGGKAAPSMGNMATPSR